jgi:hypothetical protein
VRTVRLLVAALAVVPAWATAQAKPGGSQLTARTSTRTPTLATPPKLIQLPPAQLPPDTVYPAPEVSVLLGLDVTATGTVARATLVEGLGEPFDGAGDVGKLRAKGLLEFFSRGCVKKEVLY